ncbi:MAG: EAL domain-containing protein [Gammaproteobacteria bacterium]|nr:EAL domain-containing protein [Gammaproteobacteria bacterium]
MKNQLIELTSLSEQDKDVILGQMYRAFLLIVDQQGLIRSVSNEFLKVTGYRAQELVDRHLSEFVPSDHSVLISQHLKQSGSIKQWLTFSDGAVKKVDLTVELIGVADFKCYGVTHLHVESEDLLQDSLHLFEQSAVAEMLLTPRNLNIIAANHHAQVLCGLDEITLKEMFLSDLCYLPQQQLLSELKNLQSEQGSEFNLDFIMANGQPSFVEFKVNPVQFSGKTLLHLQIFNITDQKEHKKQLQHTNDLNTALFDGLPEAALLMDQLGVITRINYKMLTLLGKTSENLIGQRAKSALPEKLIALISPMAASSHKETLKINDHVVHIVCKQQPIRDQENQSLGLLLTIESIKSNDVPLRVKALEIANKMSVYSIFVTDPKGKIIYVNEGFEQQSGHKSSGIIGKNIAILNDKTNEPFVFENMLEVINKQQIWRGILKKLRKSGASYWADVTIKPVLDDQGKTEFFVGLSLDITQQKEMNKAGIYIANYDVATGLANEILAKDRLDSMLGRARRRELTVAVIYLDISKIIDFSHNFSVVKGNEILTIYVEMLKSALRSEDALVRMSQTRLAILLPDLPNVRALEVVVAKIDKVNTQPIVLADQTYDLEVKQGTAYYPEQGGDADTLFLNAESSLQQAWQTNERIGSFGEQDNDKAIMHFNLRQDIVAALRNDTLEVVYQPILDLATNNIVAMEAKPQWHHKLHGLISGDDIYAVAESSGLMADLGEWLLDNSCIDLKHWRDQGYVNLKLSLNLSHGQLRDYDIARHIEKIIQRHQLPASRFILELPLSYISTQWIDLEGILQELSLLGVALHYDKFGERGAYISDLHNFPFSGLKISKDYISQLEDDPNASKLIQGMIAMAKALDMTVTAIGVRKLSQMLQLQEMGCDWIQGEVTQSYGTRDEIDSFLIQQASYKKLSWEA